MEPGIIFETNDKSGIIALGALYCLTDNGIVPSAISASGLSAFISAMYLCGFTCQEILKGLEKLKSELNTAGIVKILKFIFLGDNERRIDSAQRKISAVLYGKKIPKNLYINIADVIGSETFRFEGSELSYAVRLSMGGIGGILPKAYNGSYAVACENLSAKMHPLRESGIKKTVIIGVGGGRGSLAAVPYVTIPEFSKAHSKLTFDELIKIGYTSCEEQINDVLYKVAW